MGRKSSRGPIAATIIQGAAGLCLAALLLVAGAGKAQAMGFAKADTGACAVRTCVIATGYIRSGSADDFGRFLKEARIERGALVVLDSDGGDLIASLKLGGMIRRASLSTVVGSYDVGSGALKAATCASACAYVLLGGVERAVTKGGRVGVHQIYSLDPASLSAADAQWLASLIAIHVEKMGGSFGLLTTAMRTPSSSMHWLSAREVSAYGLVTDGPVQRTEFAEARPTARSARYEVRAPASAAGALAAAMP